MKTFRDLILEKNQDFYMEENKHSWSVFELTRHVPLFTAQTKEEAVKWGKDVLGGKVVKKPKYQ